jgi:arabinosaccharide transport system permease protein
MRKIFSDIDFGVNTVLGYAGFWATPKIAPIFFLAPFMILFVMFKVYPVYSAARMSFQEVQSLREAPEWVGLDNYERAEGNDRARKALQTTTLYTIGTLAVLVPLPLILAAILDSGRVVKPNVFRVILFLPALTTLIVTSVVFRMILAREGLLNGALSTFVGIGEVRWLETADLALPSLIIVATWRWTGINMIYFNAGLINIPRELYEAAAIDGANPFQMFFRITLPMIKPITFFVGLLTVIGGYQVFVEPFLLYPGGSTPGDGGLSIALLIYQMAFTRFELGYAAALGVILALIVLVVSLIQFRFFGGLRREAH